MDLEEKCNEKYNQLTMELIEPIAAGHVLAILREKENLSVNKFIDKYLCGIEGGADEQSFRRWAKEGVQPRQEVIEQIKKIPNYQEVYNKAEQVIKEKYFEIKVGNEKLDIIDMILADKNIEVKNDTMYRQNKSFLQENKDNFPVLLRLAEYSKFLSNTGCSVDFYPLMVFLSNAQNKRENDGLIGSDFNEELETLILNLKEDIVERFIK